MVTAICRITFKNFFPDNTENPDLVFTGDDLTENGVKLTDYCYNNGILIGTAMTKEVEIELRNLQEYDLADKSFKLEIGVLVNGTYEYVPYGEYKVSKYEDLKSSKKYKIIAYDNMTKLNEEYSNNATFMPTFPITLKEFYTQLMASYGIEVEEQTLPNENFEINEMPNFDGYTARTILMKIAELFGSFAKINRNNKCQMFLKTETDIQIDLEAMNSKLEIDNQYGPVNVVSIGMSNVEGENVTLKDEDSIAQYGETTIIIDDNPFIYTEDLRELVINDLYNQLHNFTYIPVKFNLKALMFTDCGDQVQVRNMEDTAWINTIILNQNIKIPRTRSSSIESLALTNTERKNQYISKSKQKGTKTEIAVDKQEHKINLLAEKTDEANTKMAELQINIDKVTQSVAEVTTALNEDIDLLSADMQSKLTNLGQALTDYQATVSTQFEQTATDYKFLFNTVVENINTNSTENNEKFAEITKYIRFEDGNIVLGKSDNQLILKIQNDRISYQQNGSEVAYFSNNKLYVTKIEVIESLQLGSIIFVVEQNGSVSIEKVGGN